MLRELWELTCLTFAVAGGLGVAMIVLALIAHAVGVL